MTPPWEPEYLEVISVLLLFTLLYVTYHFKLLDPVIALPFRRWFTREGEGAYPVFIHRLSGVVTLGLLPLFIIGVRFGRPLAAYGLIIGVETRYFLLCAVICLLLFPFLYLYSKNPENLEYKPLARPPEWNARYILLNTSSWVIYLIAYEACMRGYLLFTLAGSMGSWPAIAVTTVIVTIIHLPKDFGEAVGSAVTGVIFGAIALSSGSILIPLIIHIYVALTADFLAIRYHHRQA